MENYLQSLAAFAGHVAVCGLLLGSVGVIALRMMTKASSHVRHTMAFALLVCFALLPIFTAANRVRLSNVSNLATPRVVVNSAETEPTPSGSSSEEDYPSAGATAKSWSSVRRNTLHAMLLVWLSGIALFSVTEIRTLFQQRNHLRHLRTVGNPAITRTVESLITKLGIRKEVRILESNHAPWPFAVGCLRPHIVLPSAMAAEPHAKQLKAVLIHELAHVARGDYGIAVFENFIRVIFWWNPFIHRTIHQLDVAREEICDSYVSIYNGDAMSLVEYLVTSMEHAANADLAWVVGMSSADPRNVERRINRLISGDKMALISKHLAASIIAASLFLSFLCVSAALAQSTLEFGKATSIGSSVNPWPGGQHPGAITDDGLKLFIRRDHGDIYRVDRDTPESAWQEPTIVSELSVPSGLNSLTHISSNQLNALLARDVAGRSQDIFTVSRDSAEDPWKAPQVIPSPVSTVFRDTTASLTSDGLRMIFSSERPGTNGGADLWEAMRSSTSEEWSVENLGPGVNTASRASEPMMTSDGLMLFFGSDRPGGFGEIDIYMSTRSSVDTEWSAPANLGPNINTDGIDNAAVFWREGQQLFFRRGRRTAAGGDGQNIFVAQVVPEPSGASLAGAVILLLAGFIRRRR